jgi:hypothetical protein
MVGGFQQVFKSSRYPRTYRNLVINVELFLRLANSRSKSGAGLVS